MERLRRVIPMWIDDIDAVDARPLSVGALEPTVRRVRAYCSTCRSAGGEDARFRSHALEAIAADVFPESCHSRLTTAMLRRMDDFHERRIDILADRRALVIDLESDGGRLLLVNRSESLFDGAGSAITR